MPEKPASAWTGLPEQQTQVSGSGAYLSMHQTGVYLYSDLCEPGCSYYKIHKESDALNQSAKAPDRNPKMNLPAIIQVWYKSARRTKPRPTKMLNELQELSKHAGTL
jgi:hypothetical protein